MRYWCVFLCLVVLTACSSDTTEFVPADLGTSFQTLADVQTAIEDANAAGEADADGDSIPDSVERELGTDPNARDTDRDGIDDSFEIFGNDLPMNARLPDLDNDGRMAPRDRDEDNDGINDGQTVDTDGDGIVNYLEMYGYTYDLLTGRFVEWNGDPRIPHFFTDPLQPSTDQDALSDATEVSGALLDPTVEAPGTDPLVPAYPNIVVEVVGYSITLNEEIETSDGGSLAEGTEWSRQTESTHSYSREQAWEVGGSVAYETGPTGSATFEVSANYGETYTSEQSTSNAVSVGGSILSEQNWSRARSTNPTDAARLKLFLRVHNRGTAPLSNIEPTLTLMIGGLSVTTFQPGNSTINMLVPGATFPADENVHWVVESTSEDRPLSLTMTELRALENGARISTHLTQVSGDVMRQDHGGVWQSIGDVNEYTARCDAVCANIRIELEDGQLIHHLVYADDRPSAPRVTLHEALRKIGVDRFGVLHYVDRNGVPSSVSLDKFNLAADPATLRRNGWVLQGDRNDETIPPADVEAKSMLLYPDSAILVRAPRETQTDTKPVVHFAYLDPNTGEIRVAASDYAGIESVIVSDLSGTSVLMLEEDVPGAGYYSGYATDTATFNGNEFLQVTVTAISGDATTIELGRLFLPAGPAAPIINAASFDAGNRRIYANVVSGRPEDPLSNVAWIRAFHGGLPGGFLELERVINFFEDPNGYSVTTPAGFAGKDVRVVAYVLQDGLYTSRTISGASVVEARLSGSGLFNASVDTTGNEEVWLIHSWDFDRVFGSGAFFQFGVRRADDWEDLPQSQIPSTPLDMWMRVDDGKPNNAILYFNVSHARVGPGANFDGLTRNAVTALSLVGPRSRIVDSDTGLRVGDVFALRTSSGSYAKLRFTSFDTTGKNNQRRLHFDYVVFSEPAAEAGEDQTVTIDKNTSKVFLNGGASRSATTFLWEFAQVPSGSKATLTSPNTATANFTPDVAGDYRARLTIDAGKSTESSDVVIVTVQFPVADAGGDETVNFDPLVDDPIALDGSASIGASLYTWSIIEKPAGSSPTLANRDSVAPKFTPDMEGDYVIRLVINEGQGTAEDTVEITLTVNLLN